MLVQLRQVGLAVLLLTTLEAFQVPFADYLEHPGNVLAVMGWSWAHAVGFLAPQICVGFGWGLCLVHGQKTRRLIRTGVIGLLSGLAALGCHATLESDPAAAEHSLLGACYVAAAIYWCVTLFIADEEWTRWPGLAPRTRARIRMANAMACIVVGVAIYIVFGRYYPGHYPELHLSGVQLALCCFLVGCSYRSSIAQARQ